MGAPSSATRRPPAVSVVVLIFISNIVLMILNWVGLLADLGVLGSPDPLGALQAMWPTDQGRFHLAQIAINGTLILIVGVATIGLYRLMRWAWTLGMLLLGIGLAINLLNFQRGDPAYLLMLARVIAVILLDQEPVRFVFGEKVAAYE